MAGKGVGSVEAAKFTAVKSEGVVAGDEGPVIRVPTKRKAVVGSGYTEGDQPSEGWIDDYAEGAGEKASFDPLGSERKGSNQANLPDSAVVVKHGVDAPVAAVGSKGKVRLPLGEVKFILSLKKELPSINYMDYLAGSYTPEEIAEWRQRHEEDVALCQRIDAEFEAFQKEVRDSLLKNGYFKVDEDYLEKRKEFNAWAKEQWARINKTKLRFCAPDADQATHGYIEDSDSDSETEDEDDDFLAGGQGTVCEEKSMIAN